jgi:Holliday junction resolvase RusA-like endonuclease
MIFEVFIPLLPPSINELYNYGKGNVYVSEKATDWAIDAALIIGSAAGTIGWEDTSEYYEIEMWFSNFRMDADAPVKWAIDVLTRKLGFDDKRIIRQCSEKCKLESEGVLIKLIPIQDG